MKKTLLLVSSLLIALSASALQPLDYVSIRRAGEPALEQVGCELPVLQALGVTGVLVHTGPCTYVGRTLTAGTGISISNGDGIGGNPVITATGVSAGLAEPAGNGVVVRTATNTTVNRTITAGSGITVTNGDGVSGNPTITATGGGGSGWAMSIAPADVTNADATANTLADITGLSFPVVAGEVYEFRALIRYDAAATTTGARFVLNGPTLTKLSMRSLWSLTATGLTINAAVNDYNQPTGASASSQSIGNVAELIGQIECSANGTVQVRFASEVSSSAIVVLKGSQISWIRVI